MEILATRVYLPEAVVFFGIIASGAAVSTLIFGIFEAVIEKDLKLGVGLISIALIIAAMGLLCFTVPDKVTEHRVIVHDINEFDYDKYEIVDQEGRILTIKEVK